VPSNQLAESFVTGSNRLWIQPVITTIEPGGWRGIRLARGLQPLIPLVMEVRSIRSIARGMGG
jgi:hypothetical protein